MTVPPGFKVTLFAGEPDVVQPIAMAIDDRGRLWVAEAYSYPRRVPDNEAKDRILIFEDTNGDGRFDTRKVFADHLNLVSGLEVGFGGVWVGAAPHFLFIPDRDGDDRPDGPPQILLDGWGQQDTHETLNSFTWGPDGWLYGCHGVFTHSRVGKPGTPNAERTPFNAGIWRYHPTRHVFEVFAHGTSNPWGIDFDSSGQMIITACVIPASLPHDPGGPVRAAGGPTFQSIYVRRHQDDRRSPALPRSQPARRQRPLRLRRRRPCPFRRDDLPGGFLAGRIPGLTLHEQHPRRPDQPRHPDAPRIGLRRLACPRLSAGQRSSGRRSSVSSTGPTATCFMIDWYDKNQCHHNDVNGHDRTNGRDLQGQLWGHEGWPSRTSRS